MSIEVQLNDALKDAMRQRDQNLLACIRQLKSKVQEAQNAPDFKGPSDDAFYQRVIATYVKSLEKGIAELLGAGERGQPLRDKYAAEIAYLKRYMPEVLSEDATRTLVLDAIAKLGLGKPAGAVIGAVMKDHKGQVDAALVKRLAEQELAKK